MHRRTSYHKEFPIGALKSLNEVLDLIIEARKTKRAIRIHTVTQSGYLGCFYLTSKSKLYKPSEKHPDPVYSSINCGFHTIYPVMHDHSIIRRTKTNSRWFRSSEYPSSYGINSSYATEHRMFTNLRAATEYSNKLKNDPIYMEDVSRWHKYCSKLFGENLFYD